MLELGIILWVVLICGMYNKKQKKWIYYFLLFAPLAILLFTRAESVGIDTPQYAYQYSFLQTEKWGDIINYNDPLWFFMVKASTFLYVDFHFWLFLYSIIYFSIYSVFIHKYCNQKLLALSIFMSMGLYTYSFNIARQMMAIAFFVLSWHFLQQNNKKYSILFFCSAILTHISSIITIPILLLSRYRLNKTVERLLPLLALIIIYAFSYIAVVVGEQIEHYNQYISNDSALHGAGLIYVVWMITLIFAVMLYYSSKTKWMVKIASLGAMMYVGTGIIGFTFNYAERTGYYFIPLVILVFEEFNNNLSNKKVARMLRFAEVCCFLIFAYKAISGLEYKPFFI